MASSAQDAAARFKGSCFDYDRYRPTPPAALMELGLGWCGSPRARLVVDLGCGTGLSTRPWAPYGDQVIGIDPSEDMLSTARANTDFKNITYREGQGQATGLGDSSADVVTCSSALHWMEPAPTTAEVVRILRPGGVFLAYGHYYPVFVGSAKLTQLYESWRRNLDELEYRIEQQVARKWSLVESIAAFQTCGSFTFTRKHFVHARFDWSALEVLGFLRAHAGVGFLKERGYTDEQLLFPEWDRALAERMTDKPYGIQLTYSAFLGVKG